jgi:hypothetical protein
MANFFTSKYIKVYDTYDSNMTNLIGLECNLTLVYGLSITINQLQSLFYQSYYLKNIDLINLFEQRYKGLKFFGYKYGDLIVGICLNEQKVIFEWNLSVLRPTVNQRNNLLTFDLINSLVKLSQDLEIEDNFNIHSVILFK